MHKETVAVIYTIILGRKSYVTQNVIPSTLHHGKKMVSFNSNIDKAKTFDSEEEAEAFKEKIVNPGSRALMVEHTTITIRKPVKAAEETP